MANKPKAREVLHDVKEHTTGTVKDKVSQVGVRTKDKVLDKVEDSFSRTRNGNNGSENSSPENYATDKVTETSRNVAETVADKSVRAIRKGGKKAREKISERKAAKNTPDIEMPEQEPSTSDTANPPELPEKTETIPQIENKSSQQKQKATSETKEVADNTTKESKPDKSPKAKDKQVDVPESGNDEPKQTQQKKQNKPLDNTEGSKNTTEDIESKSADTNKSQKHTNSNRKSETQSKTDIPQNQTEEPRRKPKQRQQSSPKTRGKQDIKTPKPSEKEIKTVNNGGHKIKQTKNSIENTGRSIKTADNAFKNAEKTAKASKKTAENTVKAAKKTEEAAKNVAKATEKTVKATAKAIVQGTKAAVAAIKEVGALIASGGTTALVIIIIVCILAAVGGTCFGIFLSNDKSTGTKMTMSEAITTLTSEYYADLTAMKTSYTYDEMDVNSLSGDTNLNWKDILAIYAVKNTTAKNDGFEVVTLDEKKLEVLRKIMKDMSKMTGVVTPKVVAETSYTYDENGNPISTTKYVTKKVLTISVVKLSADEISKIYKFNDEQTKQLKELMSDEYADLWAEIIGASGDIIVSDSTYTPKDMFTWPLSINGTITSRFGTRVDPISGVVKTHGGTDIAAPTGTPILAAADGTVLAATYNAGGYGFYVKLQHAGGYQTIYGHCSVLHVTAGQTVKQGQLIADVGSTGYSTGPHCHFEVIQNGVRVDALRFFN